MNVTNPVHPDAQLIEEIAAERLAALSEPQRAAVRALAGEDLSRVLVTVRALAPTWAKVPADTAPRRSMPRELAAGEVVTTSPLDVYRDLAATNPVLAARYALANDVFRGG